MNDNIITSLDTLISTATATAATTAANTINILQTTTSTSATTALVLSTLQSIDLNLNSTKKFCSDLDFITRLLYFITGECSLLFDDKYDLIQFLKPISKYSGYFSIIAWLFAQVPQVIKNYSDKSVDGLSLGFLICWFSGDFLNLTSCLLTDAMAFQILLSSYYCMIDILLATQYYYYSQLYHNPYSRFYHRKKAQKLKTVKTPKSILREQLLQDSDIVEYLQKNNNNNNNNNSIYNNDSNYDALIENSTNSTNITNKKHIIREMDQDENSPLLKQIPVTNIEIPRRGLNNINTTMSNNNNNNTVNNYGSNNDEDEDEDPNTNSKNRRQPNLFNNGGGNSFTKMISSSFIIGFNKVNGFPIMNSFTETDESEVPTEPQPQPQPQPPSTPHKPIKHRPSAFDQIVTFIVGFINSLLSMNSHQFGKTLAWLCTFLYLSSRIPQIITNYKLRSTKGISIKLFFCALTGNLLYSISLLTCESSVIGGEISKEFWKDEISYFIGAVGTVVFDLIVLLQWYIWDYKPLHQYNKNNHNHHHNHHTHHMIGNNHVSYVKSPTSRNMGNDSNINKESGTTNNELRHSSSKPIVILSPNHVRKLSELTPLSPIDFLMDDHIGMGQSVSQQSVLSNLQLNNNNSNNQSSVQLHNNGNNMNTTNNNKYFGTSSVSHSLAQSFIKDHSTMNLHHQNYHSTGIHPISNSNSNSTNNIVTSTHKLVMSQLDNQPLKFTKNNTSFPNSFKDTMSMDSNNSIDGNIIPNSTNNSKIRPSSSKYNTFNDDEFNTTITSIGSGSCTARLSSYTNGSNKQQQQNSSSETIQQINNSGKSRNSPIMNLHSNYNTGYNNHKSSDSIKSFNGQSSDNNNNNNHSFKRPDFLYNTNLTISSIYPDTNSNNNNNNNNNNSPNNHHVGNSVNHLNVNIKNLGTHSSRSNSNNSRHSNTTHISTSA
ncbi:hypothetical protein B5S32_g4771 [[Candida] boidinii]|nr:hypothetical protein B5S32_g4771 [[Candida] boidinii]